MPAEEYDWFDIQARSFRSGPVGSTSAPADSASQSEMRGNVTVPEVGALGEDRQQRFFDFAGPLFSVVVSPASSIVRVGAKKELRALPRDRSRRRVDQGLEFEWRLVEGLGSLSGTHNQAVTFLAPGEPGLTRVQVTVRQNDLVCVGEALITVTHELLAQIGSASESSQGLPGYTFERAPGESWRSRFDLNHHVIVVNNGHRDFVYASRSKALKLRYLVRLYAKELVLQNFVGLPADQLLERMVELSLRTEEHL